MTYLEKILGLTPETPEASTVPKPIHPGGPGLWKHKHWMAPPYIEHVAQALMRKGKSESDAYHMAVGLMHSWAAGHDGHGHKTHPDVRAAAATNLAKWEELRGRAHSEHGKHDKGAKGHHDLAASERTYLEDLMLEFAQSAPPGFLDTLMLAGGITSKPVTFYQSSMMNGATAPGAKAVGRLVHRPSQTTSASPPLPPGVSLPTSAELNKLADHISKAGDGGDLIDGAVKHARCAAVKMSANQPIDALHMLRACQTGIVSAHRAFNASQVPVANVFSSSLAPAEAASAKAEMYEGMRTRDTFRQLATECAQYIDRIRRCHFHGMYNHMAEARFSAADGEVSSSTAMIYIQAPAAILPETDIDKPGHITVIYLGKINDQQYQDACERAKAAAKALPPLHGTVGGLGLFTSSDSSDGKAVAYVPVYAEGLWRLRILLNDLAAPDALPFVPHITLAYLEPGEDPPPPVTSSRVCFSELYVSRGSQIRAFAFTGHHDAHDGGGHYRDRRKGEAPLSSSLVDRMVALAGRKP